MKLCSVQSLNVALLSTKKCLGIGYNKWRLFAVLQTLTGSFSDSRAFPTLTCFMKFDTLIERSFNQVDFLHEQYSSCPAFVRQMQFDGIVWPILHFYEEETKVIPPFSWFYWAVLCNVWSLYTPRNFVRCTIGLGDPIIFRTFYLTFEAATVSQILSSDTLYLTVGALYSKNSKWCRWKSDTLDCKIEIQIPQNCRQPQTKCSLVISIVSAECTIFK